MGDDEDKRLARIEGKVDKITHFLFGNGEVGFDERLRCQERRCEERWTIISRLGWAIVLGVIAIVLRESLAMFRSLGA